MATWGRVLSQHKTGRELGVPLVLGLALGLVSGLRSSEVYGQPSEQANAAERAVHDNDGLFEQLSGPGRTRAELHFGKKGHHWPKNSVLAITEEASGWGVTDGSVPFSLLPNPLVNDPTLDATSQDTQSETTLALAAGGTVVCAFNDSGSYTNPTSLRFTGFSQSTTAAASWVDKLVLPQNADGDAGDPVLAYSVKSGTLFLSTLSFNNAADLLVFRSTNNGASFTGPVQGAPGFTSGNGSQDKEWITVDNYPGPGQGNVYMFWRNFAGSGGMTFTRSTNDGLSFGPSGGTAITAGTGQGAQVVVGPDHTVYLFWYEASSPATIVMRSSTDFGLTFGPTFVVTTLISTGVNGDLALGGFRSSTFPQAVVNPVSGVLYLIYPDATAVSGGDRGNIYFRQSSNRGTNWTAAVQVNSDLTTNAQFQPTLAVRPDGAGLAICWYDRRNDPADQLMERWGATATIVGSTVTFGPNFRLSPRFPAVFGVESILNSTYMGDYDQMVADNSLFYTTWGDNRDNSIAVPSRKNANVRCARFSLAGPGPVLSASSVTVLGGNGNGTVDPNECNDLRLVLRNEGSSAATNLSATVTTTTPGVTIVQGASAYPNVAPGGTVTNATLFRLSTSPAYVCGTPINLTLVMNYLGGTDADTASVPTGTSNYALSVGSDTLVPGTGDTLNHADDGTTPMVLPFGFSFYGQSYSSATLSANGNLQFNTANTAFGNNCLPAPGFTDAIFALWDDLRTDTAGSGIFTNVSGSTPNRIFNIEWRATYFSSGATLNFEIRLYENQPRIDLVYGTLNGNGSSATVGIQHGSAFTQYSCNAGTLSTGLRLSLQPLPCNDGGGVCPIEAPLIISPRQSGNNFLFSFASAAGHSYLVQHKNALSDATWQSNQTIVGDGLVKIVTNSIPAASRRFFRLQMQ